MAGLFNYDNGLMTTLGKICDCMILSILWCVCSIPIVTVGASTTALYYAVNKSVRYNRGYAYKEFFSAFKSNFKQGTIVWLVNLGLLLFGAYDCYILYQLRENISGAGIIMAVIIALYIFLIMWMTYVYPYMARFALPTKALMKNCIIISIASLGWSLLLLILFMVAVVAFIGVPMIGLFIPVIYMVIANRILERVFRKYMSEEDLEAEEERNRVFYN